MGIIDMKEATRLTREGRLREAMAILRGKPAANVASQGRHDAGPAGAQHKIPPQVKSILDRLGKMGHPLGSAAGRTRRVVHRSQLHQRGRHARLQALYSQRV